jgi:hypothetical protein
MWTSIAPFAEAEHAYRREQLIRQFSGGRHDIKRLTQRLNRDLKRGLSRGVFRAHGEHRGPTGRPASHPLRASLASSDRR